MVAGKRSATLRATTFGLCAVFLITARAKPLMGQPVTGAEPESRETSTPVPRSYPNELKFEDSTNGQHVAATKIQKRTFERAAAAFASFCQDWERMLHDRQIDNRAHLELHANGEYETATFIAYSKIESCQCKLSAKGSPLGEMKYKELSYYLVGRTIDDAKSAQPLLYGATDTLEIFSWEKNKWTY
jgi:hypothetical protein